MNEPMGVLPPGLAPVRVLGTGAASTVYLARRDDGSFVVVKHLRAAPDTSALAVDRFRREAEIMSSMQHPGLVRVEGLRVLHDEWFLLMEYVDGPTLEGVTALLPAPVGVDVVRRLGDALDVVHDAGVLHRDLKPANVLLSRTGECKLTDFGIARFMGDSIHTNARNRVRTKTGSVLGTPRYMAPEVAAGRRDVDQRADIYSLAVIAYRFVVGRVPFSGEVYDVLRAQIHDDPPRPTSIDPLLPSDVDALFARALAKDPRDRYGRASVFAVDLAAVTGIPGDDGHADLAQLVRALDPGTAAERVHTDDEPTRLGPATLPRLPPAERSRVRLPDVRRARVAVLAIVIATSIAIGVLLGLLLLR